MKIEIGMVCRGLAFGVAMALLAACGSGEESFDASGAFEAREVVVSAEVAGSLLRFTVEEGRQLTKGQWMGYIDSTALELQKKQVLAQIRAALSKKPNVALQLDALREQLKQAHAEQRRVKNLVAAQVATQKQLDDINAQTRQIESQIKAQQSSLSIFSQGIEEDVLPLWAQVERLNDQLRRCNIINPIAGTVLTKYAEESEMAAPGKALYKIADLSVLKLRVYVSGDQLEQVRIGQKANIFTDNDGKIRKAQGVVTRVSDKAEFTPKTARTRNERANMVYAVDVQVINDGSYKIGMYGEVKFR